MTNLEPERGGESQGIIRLTISIPASREDVTALRDVLNDAGFSPDVEQIDHYLTTGQELDA